MLNRPLPALPGDIALLIGRVVLGVVLFAHGWQKLIIVGISGTYGQFEKMGIPLAIASASFTSFVEFVGGALLVLGALTTTVVALDLIVMIGAAGFVHVTHGIFAQDGGWELVGVIVAAELGLAAAGPGRFSVDHLIASRHAKETHRVRVSLGRTRKAGLQPDAFTPARETVADRFVRAGRYVGPGTSPTVEGDWVPGSWDVDPDDVDRAGAHAGTGQPGGGTQPEHEPVTDAVPVVSAGLPQAGGPNGDGSGNGAAASTIAALPGRTGQAAVDGRGPARPDDGRGDGKDQAPAARSGGMATDERGPAEAPSTRRPRPSPRPAASGSIPGAGRSSTPAPGSGEPYAAPASARSAAQPAQDAESPAPVLSGRLAPAAAPGAPAAYHAPDSSTGQQAGASPSADPLHPEPAPMFRPNVEDAESWEPASWDRPIPPWNPPTGDEPELPIARAARAYVPVPEPDQADRPATAGTGPAGGTSVGRPAGADAPSDQQEPVGSAGLSAAVRRTLTRRRAAGPEPTPFGVAAVTPLDFTPGAIPVVRPSLPDARHRSADGEPSGTDALPMTPPPGAPVLPQRRPQASAVRPRS